MLIWLISQGEILPVQPRVRKMRIGILAAELVRRGHSVVWWSSTFSHQRKNLLYDHDVEVEVQADFKLKLVHAGQYQHNISFQRYRHHRSLARKFRRLAEEMPIPHVIVSAFPTIDLAHEAVDYAVTHNVPVIIDIRDLWPDIFVEKSPRCLKGLVRTALSRTFRKTRWLLQKADCLVAVSQSYLRWGLYTSQRLETPKDKVFYLGYDEEDTEGEEETQRIQGLRRSVQGKIVFSFIGSFGHSCELTIICDVACKMAEMGMNNIHFILAGDGEQYELISRRASLLSNMSLPGWLDGGELRSLLAFSSVGLAPYVIAVDRVPNKPFEYLSAGLPILSSLEGEMEQIIADNDVGFSYHRGDAGALCNHIVKLALDHTLRQRQTRNARELFVSKFRAKVIYDAYARYVEDIAENKSKESNK